MTHASVSPEDRKMLGISDNLIRLSVGLESIPDLLNDLDQALKASVSTLQMTLISFTLFVYFKIQSLLDFLVLSISWLLLVTDASPLYLFCTQFPSNYITERP